EDKAAESTILTGAGRYEAKDELGRGGVGRVVKALDRQFHRVVAVKELLKKNSPVQRKRFVTEALVTGNLEHPGIASVYERGEQADGSPFYSMRLVNGETLAEALQSAATLEKRLPLLPSLLRVVQTMAYAHSRGVIHRDLKPQNIILGGFGEVVILDWGL